MVGGRCKQWEAGIKWRGLGGKEEEEEEEERPLLKSGVVVRGRSKKKDNSDAGSLPPVRPSARPTLCVLTFFRLLKDEKKLAQLAFASMVAARPRVIPPVPSAKSKTYVGEGGLGWCKGKIFYAVDRKTRFQEGGG